MYFHVMAASELLLVTLTFTISLTVFAHESFPVSAEASHVNTSSFNRARFPAGFLFGTASSAYQYEGGADKGGRGPSIWDTYTHKHPERITDGSNGDFAIDSYHKYKDDVRIMKQMGVDAYRFSISWSRLLPKGKLSGGVNQEGIRYYNNLINELLQKGIVPFVTLFHWDLPQALHDEYGGFLSPRIVNDFRDYAELCFKEFGDRVKNWITLNEPWTFSNTGYATGAMAPGRCSEWQKLGCLGGDSGTEPYLVTHHQLLAHAAAVETYRLKYKNAQKGQIGITLIATWMVPYGQAKHDKKAALRAMDFMFGWFMDPLTHGDYPDTMKSLVGARLPKFTEAESKLVKKSFDFLGLNYYTANYAADSPQRNSKHKSYTTDSRANLTSSRNGVPIGRKAASDWLYVYPRGIRDLLVHTKKRYNNPKIYITENGVDEEATLPLKEALNDTWRVEYYRKHLKYLLRAIRKDGVDVNGYFAWSLLDNFEWSSGYTVRFGINYADYKNGLKRYPKISAKWFERFLKKARR
uniref:Beta-glucosidase n=1 Tax=Kalanchoe fedtschenkoi TaxID=63787 RepID=A0A7N0THN0_KALFE